MAASLSVWYTGSISSALLALQHLNKDWMDLWIRVVKGRAP